MDTELKVEPKALEFSTERPESFTVRVQNTGAQPCTLRVAPFKAQHLAIHNAPNGLKLAAGMCASFTATCSPQEASIAQDDLGHVLLRTERGSLQLPVGYMQHKASFVLEGSTDFGTIVAAETALKDLVLRNKGRVAGEWALKALGDSNVQLQPSSGQLEPGALQTIVAALPEPEAGLISAELLLSSPTMAQVAKYAVSGKAVATTVEVQDTAGSVATEVDFGSAFEGETRSHTLLVYNNGATPLVWSVAVSSASSAQDQPFGEDGGSSNNPHAAFVIAARARARARESAVHEPFAVSQGGGEVAPFSKAAVTIRFAPRAAPPASGFRSNLDAPERTLRYVAAFDFGAAQSRPLLLPLTGTAVARALSMQPQRTFFGDVPCHEHRHQKCELTNASHTQPVRYQQRHAIPHFSVKPSEATIAPQATLYAAVVFHPHALGSFEGNVELDILSTTGKPVGSFLVPVSGTSNIVGAQGGRSGGPQALPEDFKRSERFADAQEIAKTMSNKPPRFVRPQAQRAPGQLSSKRSNRADRLSYSASEAEALRAHRGQYTRYLRSSRARRLRSRSRHRAAASDNVDLGIKATAGLGKGDRELELPTEPLWLADDHLPAACTPFRGGAPSTAAAAGPFPAKPRDDAEAAVVARELPAVDIRGLLAGPAMLDFGHVAAAAEATACFCINNTLSRPVHVVVDACGFEHLQRSPHMSQVIAPCSTAAFPLTLYSKHARAFSHKVEYILNGLHFLDFELNANVIPVDLQPSATELDFALDLEDWQPHAQRTLELRNPNGFAAAFEIENPAPGLFDINPMAGTVGAKGKQTLTLRWTPNAAALAAGPQQYDMALVVPGGDTRSVQLRATPPEGNLQLRTKEMALGPVAAGAPVNSSIEVANKGRTDTSFRVVACPGVQCTPMQGIVRAGDSASVSVTLTCAEEGAFAATVQIERRAGGAPLKLPVTAEVMLPRITSTHQCFELGKVFQGGVRKVPFVLANQSPVAARLVCDLREHASFRLLVAKEDWTPTEYPQSPLVNNIDGIAGAMNARRISRAENVDERDDFSTGRRYDITINANAQLKLTLLYKATNIGEEAFQLPLVLAGNITPAAPQKLPLSGPAADTAVPPHAEQAGSNDAEDAAAPREADAAAAEASQALPVLQVSTECLATRLSVSSSSVDFGASVIPGASSMRGAYEKMLTLQNECGDTVHWQVRGLSSEAEPGCRGVFRIEPESGELPPHGAATFKVYAAQVLFQPRAERDYAASAELSAKLDTEATYLPILSVDASGSGRPPWLRFDREHTVLPAVPLSVASKATFRIVNDGYDNVDLRHRLPADTDALPLSLEFPEGTLVGIAKASIAVVVTFSAPRPTAFTAELDFLDEDGVKYSMPVSGCTDRCALTLQPFLDANPDCLARSSHTHAVMACCDKGGAVQPALMPEQALLLATPAVPPLLVAYLNAATLKGPYTDLQQESLDSNGKVLIDIVEALSGRAVPGKVRAFSVQRGRAAEQQVEQYAAALAFLQAHGALVAPVRPEHLLRREALETVVALREGRAETEEAAHACQLWREKMRRLPWAEVIAHAWSFTYLQVMRTFVLPHIDAAALSHLPGTDASAFPPAATLAASNVYSTPESILLAWLEAQTKKMLPRAAKRLVSFSTDLRDCAALCCAVAAHWPPLARSLQQLATPARDSAASAADRRANARVLLTMLEALQCPLRCAQPAPLISEHLATAQCADMVLLAAYLYTWLPQLIPRTTVEFTGKLQEAHTQMVEVRNPTKKALCYSAQLQGHGDFTLEQASVRVDAGGAASCAVKCKPSTGVTQTASLILAPRRDGAAMGAMLVFQLVSRVDTTAPLKTVNVEHALYEMKTFEVKVVNPFPQECEFDVALKQTSSDPAAEVAAAAAAAAAKRKGKLGRKGSSGVPEAPARVFPDAFGVAKATVRLKPNAEERLRCAFLPWLLHRHSCVLTFTDKAQGSFCYELVGDTLPPAILCEHSLTLDLNNPVPLSVPLALTNSQQEAARKAFFDGHPLVRDKEQAALLKSRARATAGELTRYSVSHASGLIRCANVALIGEVTAFDSVPDSEIHNQVKLEVQPIGTGLYPDRLTLVSPHDMRIIDVEISARKLGHTFTLNLDAPPAQALTQEVPVTNHTGTTLNVAASISVDDGVDKSVFTGPNSLSVPPNSQGNFALKFLPPWTGTFTGTLTLTMAATQETLTYKLIGKGLEPAAADHLVLSCAARSTRTMKVTVNNTSGEAQRYRVFTDMPCVSGADEVTVGPRSSARYTVTFAPTLSGVYGGTLTFSSASGHYVWYTLEAQVAPAPRQDCITVACPVRSAVEVEIPITNPLPQAVTLNVRYGHESLTGPDSLTLKASESGALLFYFAPLAAGAATSAVMLAHPDVGEFWYEIEHSAAAADPSKAVRVSAPLGSSAQAAVPFTNPLDSRQMFTVQSSDARAFAPARRQLTLAAGECGDVAVRYSPASLSTPEAGTLYLDSKGAGTFELPLVGTGTAPLEQQATELSALPGETAVGTLTFASPFHTPCTATVELAESAASTGIALVDAPAQLLALDAQGKLQVRVQHAPSSAEAAQTHVLVHATQEGASEAATFQFPIVGSSGAESVGAPIALIGKARQALAQTVKLPLADYKGTSGTADLELALTCKDGSDPADRGLAARLVSTGSDISQAYAQAHISWFSKQQGTLAARLCVTSKSTGGRWRFDLNLTAEAPAAQGTVVCEAHLDQTVHVPVEVYAAGDHAVPFVCSMSEDTPANFDCAPRHGVLEPRNPPGEMQPHAPISVSFTCRDFGKTACGTLFVYTGEEQFTFEVLGRQPSYQQPVAPRARIDNKLRPATEATLQRRRSVSKGSRRLPVDW